MWMDYCEDLAISYELLNFLHICLKWHAAEKNQATSQKSLGYLYWLLTQYSTTVLFGQENKNSNFTTSGLISTIIQTSFLIR